MMGGHVRIGRREFLGAVTGAIGTECVWAAAKGRTCKENLRAIHEAVMTYRRTRGKLPFSLSELSTLGMIDPALLICPAHIKAGTNRPAVPLQVNNLASDPQTLYNWQFGGRDAELAGQVKKGLPLWKLRDRQMRMGLGDFIPIVQCDQHGAEKGHSILNLTLGGAVFTSGRRWESSLRHIVPHPYLVASKMILSEPLVPLKDRIPTRSPLSTERQIDLGPAFNGAIDDPWTEGYPDDGAAEFLSLADADRILEYDGIRFELRGVVQTEGGGAVMVHRASEKNDVEEARFPQRARVIRTDVAARTLHILCGVILPLPEGTEAAHLTAVMADGGRRRLTLLYGIHFVHDLALTTPNAATIVWRREQGRRSAYAVRSVSHVIWELKEKERIVSLEFEATDSASSPFLLAVTAE